MSEPLWVRSWETAIRYATRRAQTTGIRHCVRYSCPGWIVYEVDTP